MDAIEKRARELYAKAFREQGMELTAERLDDICTKIEGGSLRASLDAIKAALTPPEGYVLVPVEPTEAMIEAICTEHASGGRPQGYSRYAQHLRREHAGEGYRAMLAARPEVP